MIVPSIDLMDGKAVQLVGGERLAIDAGDPFAVAERFGLVGPIAVIDLDAAFGRGNNTAVIEALCQRYDCRVGGGIRDFETARKRLDAGAQQIILGTAAEPELLSRLPKERVVVALDARNGDVVVDGWRTKTGRSIDERMLELRDYCAGFLVTFVEREGKLSGTAMEQVQRLVDASGNAALTIAGGVTTAKEIASLDRLGCDAQVGMALYTEQLNLADAFAAPLTSDRVDGLWPTVVVDERGTALGLVYSNATSLRAAIAERRGVYWSRRRGLWRKGEGSGASQELLRVEPDCDRDSLRFVVRQEGSGFCHRQSATCWAGSPNSGELSGLSALQATLAVRKAQLDSDPSPAAKPSYTRRLLKDAWLLQSKLREEADELAEAKGSGEVRREAADLFYFSMVQMARYGVSLADVERELDLRTRKITTRPGNVKPLGNAKQKVSP